MHALQVLPDICITIEELTEAELNELRGVESRKRVDLGLFQSKTTGKVGSPVGWSVSQQRKLSTPCPVLSPFDGLLSLVRVRAPTLDLFGASQRKVGAVAAAVADAAAPGANNNDEQSQATGGGGGDDAAATGAALGAEGGKKKGAGACLLIQSSCKQKHARASVCIRTPSS